MCANLLHVKSILRRWAVIMLLVILPATLFAQACELGCTLAQMGASMIANADAEMAGCDHDKSTSNDLKNVCPMAALCDFAHVSALLPSVPVVDAAALISTTRVEPSCLSFTSTSFPPAQRPPAA